ncbi:MAG: M56 family metallopeptidase, partial [Oscillospiraceae bacterium]|nr:M56 family metallopeptidase [Oscillospiraceae bacterium]
MTETLISSSVLILTVILLRTAFKGRISSRARYALWLIAAVRLLMPFDLAESSVSVMNLFNGIEISVASEAPEISQAPPTTANIPDTTAVPADAESGNEPVNVGNTGSENDNTANIQRETLTDERAYTEEADNSPAQIMPYTEAQEMQEESEIPAVQKGKKLSAAEILRLVWLIGTAVMLMWFIIVNVIFHAELKRDRSPLEYSSPLKIYVCKGLTSPCIFGFVKPSVYVTPEAAREKRVLDMVVAHELGHYYHGDIFWTVLRYFLLSVYWFDPFVWLAAVLSKRDCECACDEAVIRRFGAERRFEYGKAIVDMIPEKGKEMFGVASTSMSSGGRVLRERIKFISKNPKNLTAAVICTVLVTAFAAGCTFTSATSPEPEIYGEAFPDETTMPAEDIREPEYTVSDLKGKDDLYINVTDSDGREKTLFYMIPPTPGGEAFVYMDEISDDPYARIGYIPEESLDAPAKTASGYYGQQMAEFIEASRFSAADISCVNGSDNIVRHIKSSRSKETFESVKNAIADLSSAEAVQSAAPTDEMSDNICAQVEFYRENGGFSSKLTVTFRNAGGRVEGKIALEDYSGIISLITDQEQPPSEEALEKAYASSCRMESEWFEAGDSELYRLCIRETGGETRKELLPLSSENSSYESFGTGIFSENIAEKLIVTGEIPSGFVQKELGDVLVGVPYEGNASVIGSLLLWQDKDMTFRLGSGTEEDFADAPNVISGTFGKNRCAYYDDNGTARLVFEDGNANIYTAVFEGADSETAAKILGSIHMKKAEPTAPYVSAVPLSKTPSIYGDENYELTKTDWYYYDYFRANAPAMLVTGFRVTDKSREYETDFNCYIEKQEPDGKWYKVIPTGELIQANSGYRHFYTDEETGRIPVCLDLSCYPVSTRGNNLRYNPSRAQGENKTKKAKVRKIP